MVDFWRGGWLTIMRHADHDGAIRLLRLGPVPEKKRDKVPGVLRFVNLYETTVNGVRTAVKNFY